MLLGQDKRNETGAPEGAPYPVAEAPGGVLSRYHRRPSRDMFVHSWGGRHAVNRSQNRRAWTAVTTVVAVSAITGCAMFFPSRPLSDAIHLRNSSDSVDLMFCGTATVEFQRLSRGEFGGDRVSFPVAPGIVDVEEGVPTPVDAVVSLPEGSLQLAPLAAQEQVGFSFRDDDGVLHSGDFRLSEEIVRGFQNGSWLSTDGTLSADPCE